MVMKANDFQNVKEMPEQIPHSEHLFVNDHDEGIRKKEFVARLKEKKEWQKQTPMEDTSEIFRMRKMTEYFSML